MKTKELDNILRNSKKLDYFCGVSWSIRTCFTHAIVIDYKLFDSYKERDTYLKNHKRWWEKFPLVHKSFWVNY